MPVPGIPVLMPLTKASLRKEPRELRINIVIVVQAKTLPPSSYSSSSSFGIVLVETTRYMLCVGTMSHGASPSELQAVLTAAVMFGVWAFMVCLVCPRVFFRRRPATTKKVKRTQKQNIPPRTRETAVLW